MFCCSGGSIQVNDEEELKQAQIRRNTKIIKKELFKTRKNNHIGFGVSSNVFKIKLKDKYVACKVIKEGWKKQAAEEIKILKAISKVNRNNRLPNFVCSFKQSLNDTICYDFIDGVDLFTFITESDDFYKNEILIVELAYQILEGLESLLEINLVHLDIKPENIVVQSTFPIKITIIDLSFCNDYTKTNKLDKVLGTFGYISPEMLIKQLFYHNTDVWSIGIIIFLLYTKTFIFDVEEEKYFKIMSDVNKITDEIKLGLDKVPKNIKKILKMCLRYNTNYRISVVGLKNMIDELYQ